MNRSDWITIYTAVNDARYGVKYDKDKLSPNDGDVCISFVTHDYLKDKVNPYCIDIGADKCWWSIFCCERFPSLKVDAFEPNGASDEFLHYTAETYPNLRFHPYAISDKEGVLPFTKAGPDSHSRQASELSVPCKSIVPFLEQCERVDLIKIDTEGHEIPILQTIVPWLSKIGAIIFECSLHWYGSTLEESVGKMRDLLQAASKTHPYMYMMSRRDEPMLLNMSDETARENLLRHCYTAPMQVDCFLTRAPFSFSTAFYPDIALAPSP